MSIRETLELVYESSLKAQREAYKPPKPTTEVYSRYWKRYIPRELAVYSKIDDDWYYEDAYLERSEYSGDVSMFQRIYYMEDLTGELITIFKDEVEEIEYIVWDNRKRVFRETLEINKDD